MDGARDPPKTTWSAGSARRPLLLRRALLAYATVVLIAAWSLELWQVRKDREATLQTSRNDLTTTAAGLATQLVAMINDGVGAAVAAANEINNEPSPPSTGAMSTTLSHMLTGGEYVREVFIATPGMYVSASRSQSTRDNAAPAWVSRLFQAGVRDSFVGPPFAGPGGETLVPIARRVRTRSGELQWAGAAFSFDALHSFYANLPLEQGAVALLDRGGIVLMRAPAIRPDNVVGQSVADSEVFKRMHASIATAKLTLFEGPNPFSGEPRLFAAVRLADYPVDATAARDIDAALGPWRVRTRDSLEGAAVSTAAWILLTAVLYVVLRTHYESMRRSEESLAVAQQRELAAREEFAQHLLLAQEQERQRLASELHDSVGQNLSLIKNRALLTLQQPDLPPAAAEHVHALAELASDVIAEVRVVAHNLRPLHIEQLGLTDALDSLLHKAGESTHLRITQRLEDVGDALSPTATTHLYRIVQEALNNILRHADAKNASVRLERDVGCVRLTIADDGRGFDPQADTARHGLGIASIAERSRMLNAAFRIDGRAGEGTTLVVEVPIVELEPAAEAAS